MYIKLPVARDLSCLCSQLRDKSRATNFVHSLKAQRTLFFMVCIRRSPADLEENAGESVPSPTSCMVTSVDEEEEAEDANPQMGSVGLDDPIYAKQGNGGYDAQNIKCFLLLRKSNKAIMKN